MADETLDPVGTRITRDVLEQVQSLYDQGLYLQAYQLGTRFQPLAEWEGIDGLILSGRIAGNLGARRLGMKQYVSAYRMAPDSLVTRAYYLQVVGDWRGPIFAWRKFRQFEPTIREAVAVADRDEGWEYLYTQAANLCGVFRDFERAEGFLREAERFPSRFPWLLVERVCLENLQERWLEGVTLARRALEIRPWYRPAVQHLAQSLHGLDRDEEALELLTEAARRIESQFVLMQLAGLQADLRKYDEVLVTLERAEQSLIIAEQSTKDWIFAMRCQAGCANGRFSVALAGARQLKDPYHEELVKRLETLTTTPRRVQLTVPFIQQFRKTCLPATLAMLRRFWELPADQLEVAEAICYDGTPTHRARAWVEGQGMYACEFALDWEIAVALIDRQIPFALFTSEATSGHAQVVIGYDDLRRTLILRDPGFPQIVELGVEHLLKRHVASGPGCMLVLPSEWQGRVADLKFPDAGFYDLFRRVQQALESHLRAEAEKVLGELRALDAKHRLTLMAERAVYSYDTNLPGLQECLDRYLAQYPDDGNLLWARLGCLQELGRRQDRLEFLRRCCSRPGADAVFQQQLAQELMGDARDSQAASRAIKRCLLMQPLSPPALTTLARLSWNHREFEAAFDIYRLVATLDDKSEPAANAYFTASTACRKSDEVLNWLQRRQERNLGSSPAPCITWLNALRSRDRTNEVMLHLEEVLKTHPEHGDLWLMAADLHGRHGNLDQADRYLAAAESKVRRNSYLRVKADLARYRGDIKAALTIWQELIPLEPVSVSVHGAVAQLLAESSGRREALEHLKGVCKRFPYHYRLHQLWCQWARQEGPEASESVARELVAAHPADAWSRRELALILSEAGRHQEAIREAEEGMQLAPNDPLSRGVRAHIFQAQGRSDLARVDFAEALRLQVDHGPSIEGMVNTSATLAEKKEALAFIEQELVRQVVMGEGLEAYRNAARLIVAPEILLESLLAALKARPDLPSAWSVTILQRAQMLQLEESLALAKEAVVRFPLLEQFWLDLALVQRLLHDHPQERAALEQAAKVAPMSNSAVMELGHFFQRSGEPDRARECYDEACAREPLDAGAHGQAAILLWNRGDRETAIARIRHSISLQPDYLRGWQQLAAWSKSAGQPGVAEELAQAMIENRPGDVRSLLVLARLLAGAGRSAEALAIADRTVRDFPRNIVAHELRAEFLFDLKRQDEAVAACEPEVWGSRVPASLRACQARLEAERGNLVSAIERMNEVLRENPGYISGWQSLADWYWRQNQFDEAVAAATNIRRLDPLNPVPLGYLGSLKLQKNDRAGAKAEFQTATKLEPAYVYGTDNLLALQLQDREFEAAWKTLELIKRHGTADQAKAAEVKIRTRILQNSTGSDKSWRKKKPEGPEVEESFKHLKSLCLDTKTERVHIDQSIQSLVEAGQTRRLDRELNDYVTDPAANAAVGIWWMRRRFERKKWFCSEQVHRLCPGKPAARQAIITFIESAGALPALTRISLFNVAVRWVSSWWRYLIVQWLCWRHREWLRQDTLAWGTVGYALVTLSRPRAAIRWMQDWRERKGAGMWMLFNLALALRKCRRWEELRQLLSHAVTMPERDHTFDLSRLLLSFELAVKGETKAAAAHFHELRPNESDRFFHVHYQYVKSLLAVQQTAVADRYAEYKVQSEAVRKTAFQYRMPVFQRTQYRRCQIRMARDAGSKWGVIRAWIWK